MIELTPVKLIEMNLFRLNKMVISRYVVIPPYGCQICFAIYPMMQDAYINEFIWNYGIRDRSLFTGVG